MFGLDEKTKEQLLKVLKEKAESYVPEWRFDRENPDIGTALALVYADMAGNTLRRFRQIMPKNQIAFLNMLGASLEPAQPAKGYVSFSLVNEEVPGTILKAGSTVMADCSKAPNGKVSFETLNDVFITPCHLQYIYEADDKNDYIGKCYDAERNEKESYLFENVNPNLQEHVLYLAHKDVFYQPGIKRSICISIQFEERLMNAQYQEQVEALAKLGNMIWEYGTETGFEPFGKIEIKKGAILLWKKREQPDFVETEVSGKKSLWIRATVKNFEAVKFFSCQKLAIGSKAENVQPDFVLANGEEADLRKYFPFGERISVYNEAYFVSQEVLSKKGAVIELSFYLSFGAIPLDYNVENDAVKWEWVMDESAFQKPCEYDISIASVLWEYYNGKGWTRLFPDDTGSEVFSIGKGGEGRYVKMKFICPEDLSPVFVNSQEAYCIRARVNKVNNQYKINGRYIAPMVERTLLRYDYFDYEKKPQEVFVKNNLEMTEGKANMEESWRLFLQTGNEVPVLYLGFSKPFSEGPVKILFLFQDNVQRINASLVWQYYNGHQWKNINVVDETRSFSRSGIVTFSGYPDFKRKKVFGHEIFWIRILDARNYYRTNDSNEPVPHVTGIFLNTVHVINREKKQTEYFRIRYYEKNIQLPLLKGGIVSVQVLVREESFDSEEDKWITWTQVKNFHNSGTDDCHYMLDSNTGNLVFGDGTHGMIPPVSRKDNVKVVYQCGGGEYTNVSSYEVKKLAQTAGFVSKIFNPENMIGGTDMESREHAIKRYQGLICSQNRAVTEKDFENLAYSLSRNIRKTKCFSGYGKNGKKENGAVTLVILTKDYEDSRIQFEPVKEEVETGIAKQMNQNMIENGRFYVIEPVFIKFFVKTNIIVSNFEFVFSVKKKVEDLLRKFLNPEKGNFDGNGWKIGQLPNSIQIRNAIQRAENITRIENVFITVYVQGVMGMEEMELDQAKNIPFALPLSGNHEVNVFFE